MKTHHALVVEDDDRIIEQIEDTLFSLGHKYERAASQAEAQQKLETNGFDYVLLDLHIPARPGRGGASAEFGLHLLRSIRQMKGPTAMPVIIMTGQGAACVDLMSELNRLGPNEYISKPWPEKGRTLAAVVKEVLRTASEGTPKAALAAPKAKAKFAGGTIVYLPERIEILGRMITEKSHRGNFWNVLQCLRQKSADGRFKGFSGRALGSHFRNSGASQNTVASCVGDLRERISAVLAEAGVEAGEEDFILSGGSGYRFKEWITVVERTDEKPAQPQTPAPAAPTAAAPAGSPDEPLTDRQLWALDRLRAGEHLLRVDLERQFKITDKTAKRDLSDMIRRGLAVFVRIPRPGHYEIAKRPGTASH
jgi:CheY-like chemotaxis protein